MRVVELSGRTASGETTQVYKHLTQRDAIVVLRDVPEIHQLGKTIYAVAEQLGGRKCAAEMAPLMRSGDVPSIEALSVFYRAFRHLRDSRYISCLFSDLVSSLGLPLPILLDTGYCRMMVPGHAAEAAARPDLFDPTEFRAPHPNEAETMIQGGGWGNAHRDIDVRHYHYQINFWFPLHELEAERSLLLFPESYRSEVPQYGPLGDPDDPDSWGFGRALRVPLKFGDTLIFHSQQLHASPSQARARSRFTVELRVAAGCIDDNALIYRRLFWHIENFRSSPEAVERARDLTTREKPSLDYALLAKTAHASVHRLFRHPIQSLTAGYAHSTTAALDDAIRLDNDGWTKLFAHLDRLASSGEDLWLLVARIAARQNCREMADAALVRLLLRTESYFWALEAGRVAAENGLGALAVSAFKQAQRLANTSDVALDRLTPRMPAPRSRGVLQLLPKPAQQAATVFLHTSTVGRANSLYNLLPFIERSTTSGSLRSCARKVPGARWLRRQIWHILKLR